MSCPNPGRSVTHLPCLRGRARGARAPARCARVARAPSAHVPSSPAAAAGAARRGRPPRRREAGRAASRAGRGPGGWWAAVRWCAGGVSRRTGPGGRPRGRGGPQMGEIAGDMSNGRAGSCRGGASASGDVGWGEFERGCGCVEVWWWWWGCPVVVVHGGGWWQRWVGVVSVCACGGCIDTDHGCVSCACVWGLACGGGRAAEMTACGCVCRVHGRV